MGPSLSRNAYFSINKRSIAVPLADLSPIILFMSAGIISKFIMIFLVIASIVTWILIIDGVYVIARIKRSLASVRIGGSEGVLWPLKAAGKRSLREYVPGERPRERRVRIMQQMMNAVSEFMADARGGLDNLAIVSSVAPFVGLFGTVCGIITSFAGIAETQDTSLAIVAPGIAEALAATAYGLAAAIPAAIGYNRIGASFSRLNEELSYYAKHDIIRE